jgi:hypothetical protein
MKVRNSTSALNLSINFCKIGQSTRVNKKGVLFYLGSGVFLSSVPNDPENVVSAAAVSTRCCITNAAATM